MIPRTDAAAAIAGGEHLGSATRPRRDGGRPEGTELLGGGGPTNHPWKACGS